MGLDMYLVSKNKETGKINNMEVCYWRKANQIRQWFVDNTGYDVGADCEYHLLTKFDLEKLVEDCKYALENRDSASEILPTSVGFFFGTYEYDDWYFRDLENTIEQVEAALETIDFDKEDIYYYEWW